MAHSSRARLRALASLGALGALGLLAASFSPAAVAAPSHDGEPGTDTGTLAVFADALPGHKAIPALGTASGPEGTTVQLSGAGFGSALAPVPGRPGWFYGVTDRGPNADDLGPSGVKAFALPEFTPRIGLFQLAHGEAVLHRTIPLSAPDGTAYNGLPNPVTAHAASSEKAEDLYGTLIDPTKPYVDPAGGETIDPAFGYDSEGLVALADGTFWISDEYGPFLTHFDASGREIERLSPWGPEAGHNVTGALPAELTLRTKNKGMEGLAVTPDGRTLVGIMQSALTVPDYARSAITGKTVKPGNVAPVRIVTIDLATKAMHEYVYLLDDPAKTGGANSEITALSATRFLVVERDGEQGRAGRAAVKDLYEIDLTGATDVIASGPLGYTIGGRSIEAFTGDAPTAQAQQALIAAGVVPVQKKLFLALGELFQDVDPTGAFFPHDKIEGIATTDGGRTLWIANDSDFGIDHLSGADPAACEEAGLDDTTACAPVKGEDGRFLIHAKTLDATGQVDDGEILRIDVSQLR